MRGYSVVAPQFWIGDTGKALKRAGSEAVIVGMYLMTSPHANMLGLYYLPQIYIGHETGLGIEGASKGLASCIEAGFCDYDKESEMVWVHEMARYQVGEALDPKDKRSKGVQNDYDALPANPYLEAFFSRYGTAFCMTKKRASKGKSISPIQPPSESLASQEQDHHQEQEHKQDHHIPVELALDGGSAGEKSTTDAEKIEGIFAYWQRVTGATKARLGDKRVKTIRAALRWGYSPRDLCRAIQGCALTPHNQGVNDRGQKYLGLHVCLGSEDNIDRFMANSKAPPVAPEKKTSNVIPGWWQSDELALQQANLVGVGPAYASDTRDTWHARIRAAIENGGRPPAPKTPAAAPTPAEPDVPRTAQTPEQIAERRAALLAVAPGLKFGRSKDAEDPS